MTRCSKCNLMSEDVHSIPGLCRDCERKESKARIKELEQRYAETVEALGLVEREYETTWKPTTILISRALKVLEKARGY